MYRSSNAYHCFLSAGSKYSLAHFMGTASVALCVALSPRWPSPLTSEFRNSSSHSEDTAKSAIAGAVNKEELHKIC